MASEKASEEMTLDIGLMLKFVIGVGVVFAVALWIFYFSWLKPWKRREEERINRKLDTF
jgi:preprotein translocase subunit YajC